MRSEAQPWNESRPDGQAEPRPRAGGMVEQYEEEYEGDNPAYGSLLGKRKNKPKKTPVLILDAHEATKAAEVMELNAGQLMTNPQRSERITDFQTFDDLEEEFGESIEEPDDFVEDDEDELDIPEEYRIKLDPVEEDLAEAELPEEAPVDGAPVDEAWDEEQPDLAPAAFEQAEIEPERPEEVSAEMRLRQAYGFGGPITPSRSDAERFYDAAPPSQPMPFEPVPQEPEPAAFEPMADEPLAEEEAFADSLHSDECEESAPADPEPLEEPPVEEIEEHELACEAPFESALPEDAQLTAESDQEWSWDENAHEITGAEVYADPDAEAEAEAEAEADDIGWEPEGSPEPASGWDRPKGKEKLDALGQPLHSLEPDPIEDLPEDFDLSVAADGTGQFDQDYALMPQSADAHDADEEPYQTEAGPDYRFEQPYEAGYDMEPEPELMPLPTLKLEEPEVPMPRHELRARVVSVQRPQRSIWSSIWKGLVWLYRWAERRWGKPKDELLALEEDKPEPTGFRAWLGRIKF